MGTRSRTNVIDGNKVLLSIYRQFDGYPSGLGQDLFERFQGLKLTNGFTSEDKESGLAANGIQCFAAQLVAHMKDGIGNVYIRDTSEESQGEEYSYNFYEKDGLLWLRLLSGHITFFGNPGDSEAEMKTIYDGPFDDFDADKAEKAA